METDTSLPVKPAEARSAADEATAPEADSPYEIRLLDPADVRFRRGAGGLLEMDHAGERHEEVLLYRTFPLSRQEHYISVRNGKGEEIGIVERLADLEPDSAEEARKELRLRYLVPRVIRIDKIKQFPSMWVWELETTLGPIKLSMRNLHEHIQQVGEKRLLLSDMDGNRCEIADMDALDPGSRKQLLRVV
ncbi:DUF1854 domain-containing protein [Paenibacillus flagellatus]|uniref:DUF1854 domain-containing protein n=1 Tax=Paenibacillus flagellatus TaxID=2211139 RepID=A0A2V5K739_9BACL|nr:DUF1854 domain-containing protein [Paenibacillus flagellatus]PYI55128.1 DUF1854 domain-containing protein [Paenibacillus flagellatus]